MKCLADELSAIDEIVNQKGRFNKQQQKKRKEEKKYFLFSLRVERES